MSNFSQQIQPLVTRVTKLLQQKQKSSLVFALIGGGTCSFFVFRWIYRLYLQLYGYGVTPSLVQLYKSIRKEAYGVILEFPSAQKKVNAQVTQSLDKIASKLMSSNIELKRYTCLPKVGWSHDHVKKELDKLSAIEHARWEDGRVSGAVYHGGEDMIQLQAKAYNTFAVSNPIHPDVFPGVRKMEAEIVAMVLTMFNAPSDAAGTCTSGGTESILAACLTARQMGAEKGIKKPEMIVPTTVHPAFRKAGAYFNIKIHEVECPPPSYQVNVHQVARLVNSSTVLLVGSTPNFPHGVIDDISALSDIAIKRNVLLHIDCCLGSFLVPMLAKSGFETAPLDFRLPGVTSISCDTHKYGFAPKGSSVILYRTSKLRSYQYYIFPDWSGGVYVSQGMLGSRPGAIIAGCWASMMSQGETGYIDACRKIVGCAKRIESRLRSAPLSSHLQVVGRPLVSVVAFTSTTLNIWALADDLSARGWHLNAMQYPPAIHVAVTLPVVKAADQLLKDLEEAVEAESKNPFITNGEKGTPGDAFALYGLAGSLPNKGVVVKLASGYMDTMYRA